MNREERRRFVRDHRTCVFGYNRQEHGPAMTVVYYVMDGDDMLISTMARRRGHAEPLHGHQHGVVRGRDARSC